MREILFLGSPVYLHMKAKSLIICSVAAVLALAACKPTEQNYRSAYDAALKKKNISTGDADLNLPAGKLQQFDGPREREVAGGKVKTMSVRLKRIGGYECEPRSWSVAVAAYKMPTNCEAHTARLEKEGYKAFYAETPEGLYYIIAGTFDALDEAAEFARDYSSKHPAATMVGLDDTPLLIQK